MEWKRDWGLTGRVWLTRFLLFILYLVFMTILCGVPGARSLVDCVIQLLEWD